MSNKAEANKLVIIGVAVLLLAVGSYFFFTGPETGGKFTGTVGFGDGSDESNESNDIPPGEGGTGGEGGQGSGKYGTGGGVSGGAGGQRCTNWMRDDQDCDNWLGKNDCDDNDASVGPWRALYPDSDGDGYGVYTTNPREVCTPPFEYIPPTGWSESSSDCNDRNADVYPGSTQREYLRSPDYNCDGKLNSPVGTIFVHGVASTGNFGGLSGANAKCAEEAAAGGLITSGAVWTAFLSDSNNHIKDSLPDVAYRNIWGSSVANSKEDLLDGSWSIGVDRKTDGSNVNTQCSGYTTLTDCGAVQGCYWFGTQCYGTALAGSVWAGSSSSGENWVGCTDSGCPYTCDEWGSDSSSYRSTVGVTGHSTTGIYGRGWLPTAPQSNDACNTLNYLYCVRTN